MYVTFVCTRFNFASPIIDYQALSSLDRLHAPSEVLSFEGHVSRCVIRNSAKVL